MAETTRETDRKLQELKLLISERVETKLHAINLNQRLNQLFGGPATANIRKPAAFILSMPFKESFEAVHHRLVPAVPHQVFARNADNLNANPVRVLSPFTDAMQKFPLIGVSFADEMAISDPYLSFGIKPLPDHSTIYECYMRQADIVKTGEVVLALSTL